MKRSLVSTTAILLLFANFLSACTYRKTIVVNSGGADAGNRAGQESGRKLAPDFYIAKSELENKAFHLVRGIEDADANNDIGAVPGFAEDFGLVRVRITETELQFISAFDPHNREATMPIVASYPIVEQFDIKPSKSGDSQSSAKSFEENSDQPWHKREFIRVDWTKPGNRLANLGSLAGAMSRAGGVATAALGEKNQGSSSGQSSNLGQAGEVTASSPVPGLSHQTKLVQENSVLLEDPKIDKTEISWLVEGNFKGNGSVTYVYPFGYEESLSARVTYRVHLVPLAQTDYQAVPYTMRDFSKFGFFTTQQDFEDPEKGFIDKNIKSYAHLFNVCEPTQKLSCANGKIVWVLSEEFPEHYIALTKKAVDQWNQAFKQALNRPDDVVVLDTKTRASISDPTHNVISYFAPKANGELLGVAQSMQDPRTGETRAARATVYEDGINSVLGQVDDFLDLIASDPDAVKAFTAGIGVDSGASESLPTDSAPPNSAAVAVGHLTAGASADASLDLKPPIVSRPPDVMGGLSREGRVQWVAQWLSRNMAGQSAQPPVFTGNAIPQAAEGGRVATPPASLQSPNARLSQNLLRARQKLGSENSGRSLSPSEASLAKEKFISLLQAESGIHSSEFVETATLRYLVKLARRHSDISDLVKLRESIKDDVSQSTFYTTLLHEMGHAFGLRHNFYGSADNLHYTPEYYRLKARMTSGDTSINEDDLAPYAYSSVMDYGGDFFSQDAGLGPYDKAAIRYAYNRSLNREQDSEANSGFLFCTDHQTNEDIRCRAFDRGATVSEITTNEINRIENSWFLTHLRRGRANFDSILAKYPNKLLNAMTDVRMVLDEFSYQLNRSGLSRVDSANCEEDYIRASVTAGEIGNICDRRVLTDLGVSAGDISTFANALIDPRTHQLRKKASEYKPGGFADLLYANSEALRFFRRELGNPEPGLFLAVATSPGEPERLRRLSSDASSEISALSHQQNSLSPDEFVKQSLADLARIPLGRVGHPFYSLISNEGGVAKTDSLGSYLDKSVALNALGRSSLGVNKYALAGQTGSAFQYIQASPSVGDLITSLITGSNEIASASLQLASGKYIKSYLLASMDTGLQMQAVTTALTQMSSGSDPGLRERLRICSENDSGCLPTFGPAVDYITANGQHKYRAVQTINADSISYGLITRLNQLSSKRLKLQEDQSHDNASAIGALDDRIAQQESIVRFIRNSFKTLNSEAQ